MLPEYLCAPGEFYIVIKAVNDSFNPQFNYPVV